MASILNVNQIGSISGTILTTSEVTLSIENTESYVIIPSGTTAERNQSPIEGSFRYNIDLDLIEVYTGTQWRETKKTYDFYFLEGFFNFNVDAGNNLSYTGSGVKWFTDSFNANHALLIGSPQYNNLDGGYFSFDGTSQYAIINSNENLKPTDSLTQECWFKLDSNTGTKVFIGYQYGISSNNSYALWVESNSWRGGVNIAGTLDSISRDFSSTPLQTGVWYNFVHSYKNSNFVTTNIASYQSNTNIINITDGVFDFIPGMVVTGPGIVNDTTVDPAIVTKITSVDNNNNTITIDTPVTSSEEEATITSTLPPSQYLYVNGELVTTKETIGSIEYTVDNEKIVIGGDWGGPGVDTGIGSLVDGDISIVRISPNFLSPTQVKNNFDVIKARYGY